MMLFTSIGHDIRPDHDNAEAIQRQESCVSADKRRIGDDRAQATVSRIHARGRMTAQERVAALCDDEPWLLGEYLGFDRDDEKRPWRLGVLCALGTVCGRKAMIVANDNTVAAGSWWPGTAEKIVHALEAARRLRIPVIYLVECAGLYLPHQDRTFAGPHGAGDIFNTQAQLNRAGIVQLAAIFGDCIAGGGYMPLLCDKIAMTEQATMCIGSPAMAAIAKAASRDPVGTTGVHVHLSGCAESRVPDDAAAIAKLREWIALTPTPACDFYRLDEPIEPAYSIEDLYHLVPADPARSFDMEQVIARLADGSQVQWIEPETGRGILAALCLCDGLPVVIIANSADATVSEMGTPRAGCILYRDDIQKLRRTVENAHSDGIPVVWLQDVSGFDIGADAEKDGLLRYGAALLRELSRDEIDTPPHLTIVLRKASGAGYYAMKGAPFHPAITVATVVSRIEVMAPQTLAGALYDRKIAGIPEGDPRRAAVESQKADTVRAQNEAAMPHKAAMRGDVDDVVPLRDLRRGVIAFVQAAWQAVRPAKPARLWATTDII